MKYLKKFNNHAAYEAAKSGLILPNVSLCVSENEVHYNPLNPTPPTPSHDYVEIGGIKWATMNIGANSITDYGQYFQWGDISGYTAAQVGDEDGQKYFGWDDYKWTEDGGDTLTKYNDEDGLTTLQTSDDAVQAAWGGNWRMPTTEEFMALGNAVNTAWTQVDGVYGLQCTDKTDSSKVLFFPAAGSCSNGSVGNVGYYGAYWSSSLDEDGVYRARQLYFNDGVVEWDYDDIRYCGYPVRGVVG